ncbi:MAG: hypothetical protein [Bacteriophage sp.]|nr:MAG: hypothetical protein [Bacteriophage sp.]
MNNDLEQFSEERLKELESLGLNARLDLKPSEGISLIHIALAAKQAKPVAFTSLRWLETRDKVEAYTAEDLFDEKYAKNGMKSVPRYTTPQPAHTEQVIPDGWKLVPIEPTEAMCDVKHIGVDVFVGEAEGDEPYSIDGDSAGKVYRSMLAAAPKPESE